MHMKIEILGTGGSLCYGLFCNTLEALRESSKNGRVVVGNDARRMRKYWAQSFPILVVNGDVKISGRLASRDEIMSLLQRNISPLA
jgi:hypothetical protein